MVAWQKLNYVQPPFAWLGLAFWSEPPPPAPGKGPLTQSESHHAHTVNTRRTAAQTPHQSKLASSNSLALRTAVPNVVVSVPSLAPSSD